MRIVDIKTKHLSVPLKTPFKTAVRKVDSVEDVIVEIHTDTGDVGYGEAPPTGLITGDTTGAIIGAIEDHIKKSIIGMEIENIEGIFERLKKSIIGNTSAKAAVDMAIFDLYGKLYNAPLYKLLGGYRNKLETDITISVNDVDEMIKDSLAAVKQGYKILKVKVGKDPKKDIQRITKIREAIGKDAKIRIDANQGWSAKDAVKIMSEIEDRQIDIELVEQPVPYWDLEGLKYVTDNIETPVLADESVFSPKDALKLLQHRAADLLNIKLMKTGGIYNALKICNLAQIYGVECMIGCMLEAKVSVTAAAHLACAKKVITKVDLDGPVLCSKDPVIGGAIFDGAEIRLSQGPGLGIEGINF